MINFILNYFFRLKIINQALYLVLVLTPFFLLYSFLAHELFDFFFNDPFENIIANYSLFRLFLEVIMIAPFIETIIFQVFVIQVLLWISIKVLNIKSKGTEIFTLLVSAGIFSIAHIGNHIFYPILVFPLGMLLSKLYLFYMKNFDSFKAYLITFYYHLFHNLIGIIIIKISDLI